MIPLTTGQVLELDVTDLAYGGAGVSRHEGFVVFVTGALPGERVRARIEATKSSFAEGVAIEILDPSPRRVAAPCAHFGSCGGCQWMNLEYGAQLEAKQAQVRDCLERIGGLREFRLHPIAPSPQTLAYRNKVEFAFAERDGGIVLGLHRADDPAATVEIGECLLQAPEANELLRFIAAACRELRLEADPMSRPEPDAGEEETGADRARAPRARGRGTPRPRRERGGALERRAVRGARRRPSGRG